MTSPMCFSPLWPSIQTDPGFWPLTCQPFANNSDSIRCINCHGWSAAGSSVPHMREQCFRLPSRFYVNGNLCINTPVWIKKLSTPNLLFQIYLHLRWHLCVLKIIKSCSSIVNHEGAITLSTGRSHSSSVWVSEECVPKQRYLSCIP